MIEIEDITKMEISPCFNFHETRFIKTFIIDLENKKSYWEDKAYQPLSQTIEDARESNDIIYSDLVKSLTLTDYYFNDDEIANFRKELDESNFINQLYDMESNFIKEQYSEDSLKEVFNAVNLAKMLYITLYASDEKKHFVVNFDIPESYSDFASIVNNLVGYSVLSLENDKHFVNTLNYTISQEGIFRRGTDEKLEVKKVTFNFAYTKKLEAYGFIMNFNSFEDELIDLVENNNLIWNETVEKLKDNRSYDLFIIKNYEKRKKKLTEDEISKIEELLAENNVYSWLDKRSYINFIHNYDKQYSDEYKWSMEIEFEDDIIYHVGMVNRHPDSYHSLGEDLKELLGLDLLRLENSN